VKKYPIDRLLPLVCWPMDAATRARRKSVKLLLVLSYVPWVVLWSPALAVALFVSIPWAVWDDVNEDREGLK
jgi:hypothetical protein